jgi:hypothetical protein
MGDPIGSLSSGRRHPHGGRDQGNQSNDKEAMEVAHEAIPADATLVLTF